MINFNLSDKNICIKTVFLSLLMLIVCSFLRILWSSNQWYSTILRNLTLLLQLHLIAVCRSPVFAFLYVAPQTSVKSTTVIPILYIIHRSVSYLKHTISETGFCLRLQVKTYSGSIDRVIPYLQAPAPAKIGYINNVVVRLYILPYVCTGVRRWELALAIGTSWVGFYLKMETESSLRNCVF
jgi:hypothetical protein